MRYGTRSGTVLFFGLGSFPYAGTEPCRVCSKRAVRFVCFRHVRILTLLLCDEHASEAEAFDPRVTMRSFDRQICEGERAPQNVVYEVRGRMR